jgi:poly-gamma-glutamate capsule biosynthesis protein CapA/YwtB (metallophosphatase superfamily)
VSPMWLRICVRSGFDIMSRANNHATDWGLEGMRVTIDALNATGIVHAGVGENRATARGTGL